MNSLFSSWNGPVEIDGVNYKSVDEIPSDLNLDDNSIIVLHTVSKSSASQAPQASDKIYRVTVRQYMTKKSTPDFDFMLKMNNDIPMPLRTMVGTIISETPGMYKMHLKADTNFEYLDCCMKCGKAITNDVSKYFGMGPECGNHNYINPFGSVEELKSAVSNYKKEYLESIEWEGWVIKSAMTSMEEM